MNLLQKLDALEHAPLCHSPGCQCGLSEVRAAVHELVRASEALMEPSQVNDTAAWMRRVRRRNYVLAQFLDAQDNAR